MDRYREVMANSDDKTKLLKPTALEDWFIFGELKEENRVDISDGDGSVFAFLPKEQAHKILEARREFVQKIQDIFKEK